jgi:hypothetical protein
MIRLTFKRFVSLVAVMVLVFSTAAIAGDDKDKKKDDKKDNSDHYTVVKSGDGGNGVPTYSTGGLNPNPPKKDKPSNKDPKKKEK